VAHLFLLGVIYVAFISLGLPDSILGVAWPAMRADLGQPLASVGLITIALTICSAISSFASGMVVKRIGTGAVVMISGFLTGLALLGFSWAPSFGWLLMLAIPLGLGAGAVDASLNHFVAAHYSSRHMNWLHGFWGVGATIGPFIMGSALAGAAGWAGGYRTVALIQLTLSVLLLLTLPLWRREDSSAPNASAPEAANSIAKPAHIWALWLAPLTFLLYVAAEMGTGLWAASILVNDRHMDALTAGLWVSVFFGSITAGRFGVGLVANRLGNRRLVRLGILCATLGAVLFGMADLPAFLSLTGLVLLGVGCAPVFPSLMHETSRRFEPETARKVIGRQIGAAYVGGSVMPAACGLLATYAGLGVVMPLVVVLLLLLLVATEYLNRLT
jgi:fucose permease